MKFQIRNASENDVDLLVNMYIEEVENNYERAQKFAKDLIHLKTKVCFYNEEIIGSISWDTRGGLEDGIVELVGLGVNQAHRQQGIAKKLMSSFIETVRSDFSQKGYNLRVIYLFMEASNEIARLVYRKFEFDKVATIPSFYPHIDAELWIKYL